MLAVLSLLLKLFGYTSRRRRSLCDVSNSIETLPRGLSPKWLWGGILHSLMPAVCAFVFVVVRFDKLTTAVPEIVAMIVALGWVAIGPPLIWHFERNQLLRFWNRCQTLPLGQSDARRIRSIVFAPIHRDRVCIGLSAAWIGLLVVGFFASGQFLNKIAVSGPGDIFWWLMLIGVLVIGHYTAIGFCLLYKMVRVVMAICNVEISDSLYDTDNMAGMSFVGELAFPTLLSFVTGSLFIPMLVIIAADGGYNALYIAYSLVISFAFATFLGAGTITRVIHASLRRIRHRRLRHYISLAEKRGRILTQHFTQKAYLEQQFYVGLARDAASMKRWPLSIDGVVRFMVTTLVFPSIAAFVGTYLVEAGQFRPGQVTATSKISATLSPPTTATVARPHR